MSTLDGCKPKRKNSVTKGKFIMKKMRRTMAAVMAAAMMATCTAGMTMFNASADEPTTYTITIISGVLNDKATHTFDAYQVFTGTLSGGVLSDVEWGSGVSEDSINTELNKLDSGATLYSLKGKSASEIAEILADEDDNSAIMIAFAKLVESCKTTCEAYGSASIGGLTGGYYLLVDQDSSPAVGNPVNVNGAKSAFILKVTGDETVNVNVKSDTPTVDKTVKKGDTYGDWNTASVGDIVEYKVEIALPAKSEVERYDKYFVKMVDTFSEGLTYNRIVEVVNDNDKSYTQSASAAGETGYNYTFNQSGQTIELLFSDLKDDIVGGAKKITVTYEAILNTSATTEDTGNPNTVKLNYTNNPNVTHGDKTNPDWPDDDDVNGETPEDKVTTYTTSLNIIKRDGENNTTLLEGAKFAISGHSWNVAKVESTYFVQNSEAADDNTWYLLTDGTYTNKASTPETSSKYVDSTIKYEKKTTVTTEEAAKMIDMTQISAETTGALSFGTLGEGTFIITELEAPATYNKLKSPITVTISAEVDEQGKVTWSGTKQLGTENPVDLTDPLSFYVDNNKGTELPSTGGIGTTIFYVGGSALLVGAAAMFVTKKRKKDAE